ncbi:MAG: C4-dicarboxylate ABC transporter permease [Ruminococcaceae bacterium]|nr:C4-dicarboxylate ABC transporter permease [Oscillospiraceae bacterium]
MLQYIGPALRQLFTLQNFLWMNIGVFIGSVFAAIPGLTVILCIILFLPFTYKMSAIPGMMFLLGIYCAGGYGGSVSAIVINTPGTPHAAATMLDGNPLSQKGRTKAALKIALYASTFGGIFSAFMLLFLAPQVAKVAAQLGTAEYFLVCLFGLTIIAGISGKSLLKGMISACLGLFISCIGADPLTGYDRYTFGIPRLYMGLDIAICLIGLFALVEILAKAESVHGRLKMAIKEFKDDGRITKGEYRRMALPVLMASVIGTIIGIIPGTGASMASWLSYDRAKAISKHKEEFGHGCVEGIAAAETANNAVTGATLIPLLTLGIPGDGCVAIMLSALMINGLNPGLTLFTTQGDIMYAIMIGLLFVNLFLLLQGKYLTNLFAKVVSIPQEILTPIIVMFCFAGAYSINKSYFDVIIILIFAAIAWILRKLDFPTVPILLGLVLGNMTETNFRRALLLTNGNFSIFVSSWYCVAFLTLTIFALAMILVTKAKEKKQNKESMSNEA